MSSETLSPQLNFLGTITLRYLPVIITGEEGEREQGPKEVQSSLVNMLKVRGGTQDPSWAIKGLLAHHSEACVEGESRSLQNGQPCSVC